MISAVDEDLARARAADISSAAAHRGHALNAHNFITADDSDSERSSFDSSSNGDEGSRRSLPLAAAGRTISLRQLNNDRGEGGADNGLGTSQRFTTRESDGSFEALNQWLPKNITANAEKRGVVHKQCSKLSFLWQKRFFVLTNEGVLYYYAKEEDSNEGRSPKGIIMLDDLQKMEGSQSGVYDAVCTFQNRLNIHVYSKNHRVYRLRLQTIEEALAWQEAIYSHLPRIYGQRRSIKK